MLMLVITPIFYGLFDLYSIIQGSGKLSGKVCIITGGDSGIGRAVAVHYAREGELTHHSHPDIIQTLGFVFWPVQER